MENIKTVPSTSAFERRLKEGDELLRKNWLLYKYNPDIIIKNLETESPLYYC